MLVWFRFVYIILTYYTSYLLYSFSALSFTIFHHTIKFSFISLFTSHYINDSIVPLSRSSYICLLTARLLKKNIYRLNSLHDYTQNLKFSSLISPVFHHLASCDRPWTEKRHKLKPSSNVNQLDLTYHLYSS